MDRLDLVQLHCPPTDLYFHPEVFEDLDAMVAEGRMAAYGVSVERVEEALKAIEFPNVASVQIILNVLRRKPLEQVLPAAAAAGVGVIARVPLASGLLSGKYDERTVFGEDDHRNYNRDGQAFNVGETFAGLPFETGVALARELAWIGDGRGSMAAAAIRWILENEDITCVIPGFKNVRQVEQNLSALAAPGFSAEERARLRAFYEERVRPAIRGPY